MGQKNSSQRQRNQAKKAKVKVKGKAKAKEFLRTYEFFSQKKINIKQNKKTKDSFPFWKNQYKKNSFTLPLLSFCFLKILGLQCGSFLNYQWQVPNGDGKL